MKKSHLPEDLQDVITEVSDNEESNSLGNNRNNTHNEYYNSKIYTYTSDESDSEEDDVIGSNETKDSNFEKTKENISSTTKPKENDSDDFKQQIADFASKVVFGSIDDAKCTKHKNSDTNESDFQNCEKCQIIKERVISYNTHGCSFTCHKKKENNTNRKR